MERKNYNLLFIKQIEEITNRSRVTIWRWVNKGLFPAPRKIGIGIGQNAWLQEDIEEWLSKQFGDDC